MRYSLVLGRRGHIIAEEKGEIRIISFGDIGANTIKRNLAERQKPFALDSLLFAMDAEEVKEIFGIGFGVIAGSNAMEFFLYAVFAK